MLPAVFALLLVRSAAAMDQGIYPELNQGVAAVVPTWPRHPSCDNGSSSAAQTAQGHPQWLLSKSSSATMGAISFQSAQVQWRTNPDRSESM